MLTITNYNTYTSGLILHNKIKEHTHTHTHTHIYIYIYIYIYIKRG